MKSTRPADPAATQGKKLVPPSLLTSTGTDQVWALLLEWENQISKLSELRMLSGNTEYTFPAMPTFPESSTASVAKISSMFVPMPLSHTRCASLTQLVTVARPVPTAGAECATQAWWKFWICVILQTWVVLATGSAVIHCTYTSPVSGSTSI